MDLNPHQVDAALFTLRSPLSKGAILADEVGLGKTIGVGIFLAQRWANRKRRILLVVPTTLREQWQQELDEKCYLPSMVFGVSAAGKPGVASGQSAAPDHAGVAKAAGVLDVCHRRHAPAAGRSDVKDEGRN